jgi:hypothetical protein
MGVRRRRTGRPAPPPLSLDSRCIVAVKFDLRALSRQSTGEPRRRLEHKIALHKAASEVRYIVIFNNGSPTEPSQWRQ